MTNETQFRLMLASQALHNAITLLRQHYDGQEVLAEDEVGVAWEQLRFAQREIDSVTAYDFGHFGQSLVQ